MDLTLKRNEYGAAGIFGVISTAAGQPLYASLEHAYQNPDGRYVPKIPPGKYACVRSKHRLHGMTADFETFEVTGVLGHSGLLFHAGNFNRDSEGCILLGMKRVGLMVTQSRQAFEQFMTMQTGLDSFELEVT